MSGHRDLREYLDILEKAGKLRRISRRINKDTELHSLVAWQFRGLDEPERTGFLFEDVTDLKGRTYACRVATAVVAPSRDVYALAMKCAPDGIDEKWRQAFRHRIPPRLVGSGPVKEEIHIGDNLLEHGGLHEFPIPMTAMGWESLPRLTALAWHSKDPDTGIMNVGCYNGYLLGPLRSSCRCNNQLVLHWNKCRERGIPLQAAAVIGASPAMLMASVARVPYGVNEQDIAGGIAGVAIDVVKCETVALEVPASAEIVIEGEIPTDYMEPDPACSEHTGNMMINRMVYAFNVKCITHRKNPIWHDIIIHTPPSEDTVIRAIDDSGRFLSFLRDDCGIAQVREVALHYCGAANRLMTIKMQDVGGVRTRNSVVWQALFASLSISDRIPKLVIAVDEDIDPWDMESVFWAVSFRYQPHRDTRIVQGRNASLDQSAGFYGLDRDEMAYPTSRTSPQGASAMLIDATRKWDYTPVALPKRDYMERGRNIWNELGLPPLKPKAPWHGVSLGMWPEKYERQATMAEHGEFEKVAQEIMSQGKRV